MTNLNVGWGSGRCADSGDSGDAIGHRDGHGSSVGHIDRHAHLTQLLIQLLAQLLAQLLTNLLANLHANRWRYAANINVDACRRRRTRHWNGNGHRGSHGNSARARNYGNGEAREASGTGYCGSCAHGGSRLSAKRMQDLT